MTNPTQLIEQLARSVELSVPYLEIASRTTHDGTGGEYKRLEAKRRLELLTAALTAARAHLEQPSEDRAAMDAQVERVTPSPSYRADYPTSNAELDAENKKAKADERLYGVGVSVNGWHVPAAKVACWGMSKAVPSQGLAAAWDEGYAAGVNDERISESNTGVAGFDAKVNPARENPHRRTHPQPTEPAPSTAGERADWDTRGLLASKLKCWHRLTEEESDELVALLQSPALPDHPEQHLDMVAALPVGELTDSEIDAVSLNQWGPHRGAPLAAHRAFARAILAAAHPQPVREPLSHPTASMQAAGGAVELDYTGVDADPDTVGWLTAARVWIAMENARNGITQGGKV